MKRTTDPNTVEEQRGLGIHSESLVINSLDSTPCRAFDQDYVDKLKQSGVTAINVTAAWIEDDFEGALLGSIHNPGILGWYEVVDRYDDLVLVRTVDQLRKLKQENKIGLMLGFQNAKPVESKTSLHLFRELGIRIIQLAYMRRNLLGDGGGERLSCGLSKFGVEIVEEMNRRGIVVDLSHVSKATALDAIEVSKEPAIFSHSSAFSLCRNIRNVDDATIKALAEKGGVIGIAAMSMLLSERANDQGSTVQDYLNHIDYVADLVGTDHVGIGLSAAPDSLSKEVLQDVIAKEHRLFPEFGVAPSLNKRYCLRSITELTEITKGLVGRGYSDNEIKKIIGGNFLRVFSRVWK